MRVSQLSTVLAVLTAVVPSLADKSFKWSGNDFLLNGNPHQLVGGQMDPQRIPWQLWDDRMEMAQSLGLNTIFSYVYWSLIEPVEGTHVVDGNNNIAAWVRSAAAHNLSVVLRPGPYVDGEIEWAGFPSWLSQVPDMVVRSNNAPFLAKTATWLNYLGNWLQPYYASNGGPILMVQIENEYGFYVNYDPTYPPALANIVKTAFPGVTQYTNDGLSGLAHGAIPGILAETDNDVHDSFRDRDANIPASSVGPYLDGEYYISGLDKWGSNITHTTNVGDIAHLQTYQADYKLALSNGSSLSMYMFHGGTNWGFTNGAYVGELKQYQPITTSYDFGAPLDESGRTNSVYDGIRETIIANVPYSVPDVPKMPPMASTSPITLTPYLSMFDGLPTDPVISSSPQTFEQLQQPFGFMLYRYTSAAAISGAITLGDGARDRVLIYVNNKRVGVVDATYMVPAVVNLNLKSNDVLDLLVENLGRANFGWQIQDQQKGILGDVSIGGTKINGFTHYKFPCDTPTNATGTAPTTISSTSSPIWYQGTFDIGSNSDDSNALDTFLELPGWVKGVVYVNGINIGRFWTVGPQQSLYVPGVYLTATNNSVTVLNLEPTGSESTIQGVSDRTWANNPDPDFPST